MRIGVIKRVSITLLLFFLLIGGVTRAQEVGLSFSYFLPKNGYFSTPISPFSLRGVGIDLNKYFAVQTGFSLYRMSGLNIKDIDDFDSKDALVGPNFTLMVPAEIVLQFIGKQQEFRIKGGGFGFITFDNKLNSGNIDKAIREFESWDVANSSLDFDNSPGFGYFFGVEYVVFVTRQWGLSFEANYLIGGADFALTGSYTGGNTVGGLITRDVDYDNAKLDLTGLELSIGIIITQ